MHPFIVLFIDLFFIMTGLNSQHMQDQFREQRDRMVELQILRRGITDASVLDAMRSVPRHEFVPAHFMDQAYGDHPLPIGEGQTISQPYIVALMTGVLELGPGDRVLEIGTGSGYQAAVLAEICDSVFSIELVPSLGRRARRVLGKLGYENVVVKIGDGYRGWPEKAPFDAIIVTCAPEDVPEPLEAQLTEGGKMVIPVGGTYTQELILLTRENGRLEEKDLIPVRFVPMKNADGGNY
ncbi:MAG: protein-L-isoaspartate(D-aspartate) O-methyltransferase [Bacteroidales bacterium]